MSNYKVFTTWLLGFAELSETPPTEAQWIIIKNRLDLAIGKRQAVDLAEDAVVKRAVHVGSVTHDHMDNRPLKTFKKL